MSGSRDEVALLLCTYNGGRYLPQQLDSLVRQEGVRCRLYISDDGSTDATGEILEALTPRLAISAVQRRRGPGRGYVANFLGLASSADLAGQYFAFADQDDIWDCDKLKRAVSRLAQVPADVPALYCSRTRAISEAGELLGLSPLFRRAPAFANALVQNIGGGNTMVFNRAARELLCRAGPVNPVSHDWWLYLLVSGAGGVVVYDPAPSLSYRQHRENIIGANLGLAARLGRYRGLLWGRNRRWNARNIKALRACEALLGAQARAQLGQFERVTAAPLPGRLLALYRGGFYAQGAGANVGLYLATLLKKI